MLKEIQSTVFRENRIQFHKGLNIVVGDNEASNSIGKSTFLMIIDFIFGGNTYIKYNKDVVENMGQHDFWYYFEDENNTFRFMRTTRKSDKVYECDDNYNIIKELSLIEYNTKLKKIYKINSKYASFREIVSLYSRIWGKDNYDIKKPLNTYTKAKETSMINNLIKVFDEYDSINSINENIQNYDKEYKALSAGMKFNYIPNINKKKYSDNIKEIEKMNNEIYKLKNKINIFSMDIAELTGSRIIELNKERRILLNKKEIYANRINRIENNILKKVKIDKKQFEKLIEIFPNANIKKLIEIECFHKSICKFLNKEIQEEKQELTYKIEILDESIKNMDDEISKILNIENAPNYILEALVDIKLKLNMLEKENEFFDKKVEIKEKLSKEKILLEKRSKEIIIEIENKINSNMKFICRKLLNEPKKAPRLEITNNRYNFHIYDDTGAGNAYSSLIILDLAIFMETKLPILIHDSMLFKNIQKDTMENLICMYNSLDRQVFIAIDEIFKYDKKYIDIINKKKVLELNRKKTLFTKIWNRDK